MIYIVEIPHRFPPTCWTATDKADFIARSFNAYIRHGDTPDTAGSIDEQFDAWVDYIASDLSSLLVYESEEAAREALESGADFNRHGGNAARSALARKMGDE